jgi:hypothetical protein
MYTLEAGCTQKRKCYIEYVLKFAYQCAHNKYTMGNRKIKGTAVVRRLFGAPKIMQ